ncbi:MAG: DUF6049 family protein [Microbacterium sp.]
MTVTSPRKPAWGRALRVRALATLGAALLIVGIGLPAVALGTGGAVTSAATPSPSPTRDPGPTTFTLSPVGNGIVRPGEGLAVSVHLRNTDLAPLPAADITLAIGDRAIGDREELSAWLDGTASDVPTEAIGATTLEAVPAGKERSTGIVLAADDPAIAGRAPGVYPLIASYATPEGTLTSTSAMIVPRDDASVGIGVVVPITAGPRTTGLLTADELVVLTSPAGSLTSQLDAVEATSAILAVDPAIAAAIRVLGSSAPESATAWLARLEGLANSRFALQFGDADPAVEIQAGLPAPVGPTSLTAFMTPADFAPDPDATPTPAPSPSPSIDPTAPVYPDLATLLAIGPARAGVFWPAPGQLDPGTVKALGAIAAGDRSSVTLLPSTATDEGASGETVSAHASTGDADLLVYDADVSRELSEASLVDETALRGAALTAATAYLAFATADTDGAPLMVALDRATDRSRVGLRTAILAAAQAPQVTPLILGGLLAAPASTLAVAAATPDAARIAAASALFVDETALSRFATILDDASLITGPERATILQLLSVAWDAQPEDWAIALGEHRLATQTTLGSVHLLPTSTINLFGSGAGLRFTVRNQLPYPVNLVLYATPDDLRLDVQRANPVVATANSNTRVEVPVQARVGNGEVTLALQLRSRASVAIGPQETVDVNVRAEWETFGFVALGLIVGGLVLLGIVRTVLRVRSRSRARSAARAARINGADAAPGEANAVPDEEPAPSAAEPSDEAEPAPTDDGDRA